MFSKQAITNQLSCCENEKKSLLPFTACVTLMCCTRTCMCLAQEQDTDNKSAHHNDCVPHTPSPTATTAVGAATDKCRVHAVKRGCRADLGGDYQISCNQPSIGLTAELGMLLFVGLPLLKAERLYEPNTVGRDVELLPHVSLKVRRSCSILCI